MRCPLSALFKTKSRRAETHGRQSLSYMQLQHMGTNIREMHRTKATDENPLRGGETGLRAGSESASDCP